jgi:hypothetical protein
MFFLMLLLAALPRPAHVVIVIEENHTAAQIAQSSAASYLHSLAATGAVFTDSHGVTHPSLPNYLALFAGVTNTNGDECPPDGIDVKAPNLASELFAHGFTFAGYSEGLPQAGSRVCWAGDYARKHAPWVDFSNVPAAANQPLTALPQYDRLPTVAMVVPDVDNDMHSGSVHAADDWAREHVAPLAAWAKTHNTLIIFTWDEGYDQANSIPTFFIGPMVKPGRYWRHLDHYDVLATLEAMYGLRRTGGAARARIITDIWK